MLKTLLVPTDGSTLAGRAIPYATALARATNAKMVLWRAVETPQVGVKVDPAPEASSQLEVEVGALRQQGLAVESQLQPVDGDEVGESIVDAAATHGADLIVMSTHGRSGIGRVIYGSVADRVLRIARQPVLMIPAACEQAWPTDRPPRILVPLDRSELGMAALGPAVELARQVGGELILVHVIAFPTYAYSEGYAYSAYDYDLSAEMADATRDLEAAAEAPRAAGLTVRTKVTTGYATAEVAAIAREEDADLVVMATHGRGGLARLVLGSVATAALQRTGLPVLLVRPFKAVRSNDEALPETQAVAAAPATIDGTMRTISLTAAEVDLIERGLSDLLYLPESDPRLAKPVRALLTHLKEAEAVTAGSPK